MCRVIGKEKCGNVKKICERYYDLKQRKSKKVWHFEGRGLTGTRILQHCDVRVGPEEGAQPARAGSKDGKRKRLLLKYFLMGLLPLLGITVYVRCKKKENHS